MDSTETLYTEEQRSDIIAQLGRMLENSHFSHSRRFPSFLRFIVQEELEGRGDQLKERTIGIEVFGRDAGYDTTADPIVRVTAAEIRKRIAQYYQECGRPDELRISLPAGSYVPHFAWSPANIADMEIAPSFAPEDATEADLGTRLAAAAVAEPFEPPAARRRPLARVAFACIPLVLLLFAGWAWMRSRPTALDQFWAPVLDASESVVVCFPRNQVDSITLRSAAKPEETQHVQEQMNAVMEDDLQPLVSLAGLLEMRRQRYTLMGQDAVTLTDLRRAPTVFLGAFDNAWTLRVTRGLRYRFGNDAEMKHFWIEDTQSPARWQIDRNEQIATNNYRDYAIVARFVDASTGQIAVVSAGIARGGTIAAGEFLTQAANMETIKALAPKGWAGKNMELVLSTEIIDGRSAPPRIERTYFW